MIKYKLILIILVCYSEIIYSQPKSGRYNGLLVDKFQSYTTLDDIKSNHNSTLTRGGDDDLPDKYSLEEFMPEIGDQGDYGSCVGWAIGYYAASIQWNFQNGYSSSSEKDVFSPWYVWNNNKIISFFGEEGTYFPKALNWISKYGIKKFDESPQKSIDVDSIDLMPSNIIVEGWDELFSKSSFENCTMSKSNKLLDVEKDFNEVLNELSLINDVNDESEIINNIKNYISSGIPVLIGVSVGDSLKYYPNDKSDLWGLLDLETESIEPKLLGVTSNYTCDIGGYHAMTIVAYDDSFLGGCFKVANSWGEDWGFDGFMYLSYKDFFVITDQAYAIGEIKVIDPKLLDKKVPDQLIAGAPKHGLVVEKFANGKVKRETNYVRGLKSGTEIEYYVNGKIKSQSIYQDNIPLEVLKLSQNQDTTDFIKAYENERNEVRYNCMKKRGTSIFDYEMVKEKTDNQHFYLDNAFVISNLNGVKLAEGDFRGEEHDWFNDTIIYYRWNFYEDGMLKHEFYVDNEEYKFRINGAFKSFDKYGDVNGKGTFKDGMKFGLYQEYDKGKITKEGTYYNDEPFGIWLQYDNSGGVIEKKVFGVN